MDISDSSEEELEMMAAAVVLASRKKKRKHRVWVRGMYFKHEKQTEKYHQIPKIYLSKISNNLCVPQSRRQHAAILIPSAIFVVHRTVSNELTLTPHTYTQTSRHTYTHHRHTQIPYLYR